ncbi:MFS transporter [Saccharopolyspora spinosa]|uniref:D-galactonate transporter n=1 Tax=Saccharopolyspora spinosa TaxID=60894 RepID=Q6JHQ6_SACSN|nr:MFS transporter [Saccharopolyspora spinosa]AAS00401.1 transmembrane permease [Saccharopolyspora spinosa NRRL 18395]PKW16121.1 D-galactonate transporter [Saccharopolyspora spinosa]
MMEPETIAVASRPDPTAIYRRVALHLMPFLMLCYIAAYLDRINVGFAKLNMQDDLGLSNAAYGLGAGLFFIGYLVFEVPSNLVMMRIGARRTIARIMILWAIISAAFAFVGAPWQFYVLRFLLGAAEAGFYPGVILYLSYWFPSVRRAKMVALFVGAVPLAGMIGAPLSGGIIQAMHGLMGLQGWRWMFLIEAVPSLVLGLLALKLVADSPASARWLGPGERRQIETDLAAEREATAHDASTTSLRATLANPRVWLMTAICFCSAICSYGVSFWLPTLVQQLSFGNTFTVGLLTTVPFAAAFVFMFLIGRSSDRHRERRWHLVVPFALVCAGLTTSVVLHGTQWAAFAALTVAAIGAYSTTAMLFSIPGLFLGGVGMAAGVALINSLGGLGGFTSPYIVGLVADATGTTDNGVYFIAAAAVVGAVLTLALPRRLVNR